MIAGDWWWVRLAYFDGCPLIQNHPEYMGSYRMIVSFVNRESCIVHCVHAR